MGLSSISLTQLAAKVAPNSEEYRAIRAIRRSRSSIFRSNNDIPCDFILVINTNLHAISHGFQAIVHYLSNFRFRHRDTNNSL